jgi:hypothetical protein
LKCELGIEREWGEFRTLYQDPGGALPSPLASASGGHGIQNIAGYRFLQVAEKA